ncbi:hypothetical protein D5086_017601 [Populus alba]|uniref:Uncharacterized protein n=1 Tax=Populus alba TaxID=43335 RepID=A0ACC4BN53_POPAL
MYFNKAQTSEGQAGENAEQDDTISVSRGSAGFASHATVKAVNKLPNGDAGKIEVDGKSILFKSGKPGCDGNSELGACHSTPHLDCAQGTGPPTFNYHGTEGIDDAQNLADLSSDFANTFMLEEELELEQKTLKNDECSPKVGTVRKLSAWDCSAPFLVLSASLDFREVLRPVPPLLLPKPWEDDGKQRLEEDVPRIEKA